MRILHASVLLASLAILGPHAETLAQQSATTETIPAEEPKAPAGERDGYLQMARTEMRDWQLRLERFNEKAEARAKDRASDRARARRRMGRDRGLIPRAPLGQRRGLGRRPERLREIGPGTGGGVGQRPSEPEVKAVGYIPILAPDRAKGS